MYVRKRHIQRVLDLPNTLHGKEKTNRKWVSATTEIQFEKQNIPKHTETKQHRIITWKTHRWEKSREFSDSEQNHYMRRRNTIRGSNATTLSSSSPTNDYNRENCSLSLSLSYANNYTIILQQHHTIFALVIFIRI